MIYESKTMVVEVNDYVLNSLHNSIKSMFRDNTPNILSYHRYFIRLKSACRIYYSYLRHAIHGRVTSEINVAKMQSAAIFSLDSK